MMAQLNVFARQYDYANRQEEEDEKIIMRQLPGCIGVKKTGKEKDKKGIDYIATTINDFGTSHIGIDVKRREQGASRYWTHGPEICFEIEAQREQGVQGWLADSKADYNLYVFDPTDCDKTFLVPLIVLRAVWTRYGDTFIKKYGYKRQKSQGYYESWTSKAVFVPVFEVYRCFFEIMGKTK